MKAAVFEGPETISIREVELAPCGPDDMIVKVHACGICGSDVRNFKSGLRHGVEKQIMGHEFTGKVTEIGENVRSFSVGDLLAFTPDVSCGECTYCKRGWVNLCNNHRMLGTNWPGGFAEYVHIPEVVIRRGIFNTIPDGVSLDDAALSEPASSVLACQERAGLGLGDSMAVFGDGPIGCLQTEVARARGASTVIMVGLARLDDARRFQPDLLIDAASQDPVREIKSFTGGAGVDVAVCANPVASTQEQAVESVRKRGRVILFGGLPKTDPMTSLNSNIIHYSEVEVVGAFSYESRIHWKSLLAIRDGAINPKKYFNRTVSLDDIVEGFRAAASGEALKVLVKP